VSKISVIVPVYNKLHLFEKCLFSLCHQSRQPDEIIISDDGSSEDVLGLLQQFDFPFPVKLVRQEDRGFRLARCRNNAARIATGEFLIFADQDIVYTKNYIQRCEEFKRPSEFLTPYPVRLSEEQSHRVTDQIIKNSQYDSIVEKSQIDKLTKQYRSELFYSLLFRLKLRLMGPKLRGGLLAIHTDDYIRVNGFDEKFIGWGNEDDDMGRRLHQSNIVGRNAFVDEYPIHLWHPPHHVDGERVNKDYTIKRKSQIRQGHVRPEFGFDNTFGDDPVDILEIN
jgi:glycosyltransferase involved in cell wall biosynthesis